MKELWSRLSAWLEEAEGRQRVARYGAVWAAVLAGTVLLGAIIGTVLVGNPSRSADVATSKLDSAVPREVFADAAADVEPPDEPVGFAGRTAGVALLGVGEVDRVRARGETVRAPEGGRLLSFKLGDWQCAVKPCAGWRTLAPVVLIDGTEQDLPAGGDTFVMVVPPGTDEVELVADTDDFVQSISLLDATPGSSNITLLGTRDRDHTFAVDKVVAVTEQTSTGLDDGTGQLRDTFQRNVTVGAGDRSFFLGDQTPNSPNRVFLSLRATFAYAGQQQNYLVADTDVYFEDSNGEQYRPRPLDTTAQQPRLVFEIPARLKGGDLVFAGATDKTSTTGTPYTSTLVETRLPITFG